MYIKKLKILILYAIAILSVVLAVVSFSTSIDNSIGSRIVTLHLFDWIYVGFVNGRMCFYRDETFGPGSISITYIADFPAWVYEDTYSLGRISIHKFDKAVYYNIGVHWFPLLIASVLFMLVSIQYHRRAARQATK